MAKVKLTKTTTSDPLGTVNKLKTYVGFEGSESIQIPAQQAEIKLADTGVE